MEIERKFTIKELPKNLSEYKCLALEQGYLNTNPVVRVRKEDDTYYLTYKGKGFLEREEYNLPLNEEAYKHLVVKADGNIISKSRYCIPYSCTDLAGKACEYTIELDVFKAPFEGLIIAEVEFESVEDAHNFVAPEWFLEDVTEDRQYSNSELSKRSFN